MVRTGNCFFSKIYSKIWNLNIKFINEIEKNNSKNSDDEIEKFTNKFIKKITNDLENFHYNVIIANCTKCALFLINK